jgi:hypothetical protein
MLDLRGKPRARWRVPERKGVPLREGTTSMRSRLECGAKKDDHDSAVTLRGRRMGVVPCLAFAFRKTSPRGWHHPAQSTGTLPSRDG